MAHHQRFVECLTCGILAEQVITAPMMVKVCADVHYDSPITGEAITNWHAREEDLKRHDCRPYDPDMKVQIDRQVKQEDEALDRAIDSTIEEAIEKMPTAKRGHLATELLDKSVALEYGRSTPHAG